MLKTIIELYKFAGSRSRLLKKGLITGFISGIFSSLQILALAVVLKALIELNVTSQTAWLSLGIMVVSTAGNIIIGNISRMAEMEGTYMMCADHRGKIGDRMKYMPMGYFNKNSLGYITSVVTTTMEDLQEAAPIIPEKTVHGIIDAALVTLVLLIFDWRIGLISFAGILLFGGATALVQRQARWVSPKRLVAQTNLVGAILEYVQGIGVIKAFNQEGKAQRKINEAIAECQKWNVKREMAFIPNMFLQALSLKLVGVLLITASIVFYFSGTMDLYSCLLMLIASFMIYSKLEMGGLVSALMRSISLSMEKVNGLYGTPTMETTGKAIVPENLDIKVQSIRFSYEDKYIIDDISFTIPQGTTTAFVGPSGGGKTTLCNLIARFWDVDEGEITLGGRNLKDYTLDSLLANISMVFQNVYLFNDTIANNIKFGKPDATMDEVIQAAKKGCCHDFIMALPDGYDTVIGEGGATVSGGEKQRISIARAILKDAPIIILDEATANVDPENENELQHAIGELTKSKTVIMIAHRLKTVRHANQILVIENGKLIQQGNHEQLFNEDGIYRDFIKAREKSIGWRMDI